MSDTERASKFSSAEERSAAHDAATAAFAESVRETNLPEVVALYVFGSVARGEAKGLSSDIDMLVVIADTADLSSVNDTLQKIAFDVMLEYGPPVEIHLFRATEFHARAERGEPFVANVLADAKQYV